MNRTSRILLGVASFLPVALGFTMMIRYMFLIRGFIRSGMMAQNDPQQTAQFFGSVISTIFPLFLVLLVVFFTLLTIFILHAVRNRTISDGERAIWILAFVIAGTIAFPVYFFLRVAGQRGNNPVAAKGF